ncbi:MAG: right-handed parallel beta-helix repeat-containing protein [Thermoguttaceae bacterium]|jgi:hypothetical protein
MKKLMLLCAMLSAMAFVIVATPAHAANTRSWVSALGSDSNACTQAAPCLTFAHAITQTSSGGEIDCLSGGDFGSVTITFSITIDCGVGQVGVASSNGTAAITLNTSSSAVIVLRNLNINGFGADGYGILTASFPSGTLIVEHCLIHGFTGDVGIYFSPSSGRATLQISDTSIFNNEYGITIYPSSGVIVSAVFNRVEITTNSQTGLTMEGSGTIAGTLRQSLVADNGNGGIYALASAVYFTVEESSIIDNLETGGIATGSAGANLEVGASTIGGNGTGIQASTGSIYTFGNNQLSANGSNGSFTPGGPGLQ